MKRTWIEFGVEDEGGSEAEAGDEIWDADQVEEGLFVGGLRSIKQIQKLRAAGITHILAVHERHEHYYQEPGSVRCLHVAVLDRSDENLLRHLHQCCDFIQAAREQRASNKV